MAKIAITFAVTLATLSSASGQPSCSTRLDSGPCRASIAIAGASTLDRLRAADVLCCCKTLWGASAARAYLRAAESPRAASVPIQAFRPILSFRRGRKIAEGASAAATTDAVLVIPNVTMAPTPRTWTFRRSNENAVARPRITRILLAAASHQTRSRRNRTARARHPPQGGSSHIAGRTAMSLTLPVKPPILPTDLVAPVAMSTV